VAITPHEQAARLLNLVHGVYPVVVSHEPLDVGRFVEYASDVAAEVLSKQIERAREKGGKFLAVLTYGEPGITGQSDTLRHVDLTKQREKKQTRDGGDGSIEKLVARIREVLQGVEPHALKTVRETANWIHEHYDEVIRENRRAMGGRGRPPQFREVLEALWHAGKLDPSIDGPRLKGWIQQMRPAEYAHEQEGKIRTVLLEIWHNILAKHQRDFLENESRRNQWVAFYAVDLFQDYKPRFPIYLEDIAAILSYAVPWNSDLLDEFRDESASEAEDGGLRGIETPKATRQKIQSPFFELAPTFSP